MSSSRVIKKLLDDVDGVATGSAVALDVEPNEDGGKRCLWVRGLATASLAIEGQIVAIGDPVVPGNWVECEGARAITVDGCYSFDVSPTHVRAITTGGGEVASISVWLA